MKAAYVEKPGPPDSIVVGDLPTPEPAAGQVRVKVVAASVNPVDTYLRSGAIAMDLPLPYVVGCDLAGTVETPGAGVTDLAVGDRVWASNQGLLGRQGTFAEFACVDRAWVHRSPDGVADEDLAAAALVGITAHLGLFLHGGLKAGETVYVGGGSGGVGSMVVQMAKAAGARVLASAGASERVQQCRDFGADEAFDHSAKNVAEEVGRLAPDGIDLWWFTHRDPDLRLAVPHMRRRGRIVLMAGRDATPELPLGAFYTNDLRLIGFAMFNAGADEQKQAGHDIGRWLADGKLRANIGRRFPLDQAADAHRLQEDATLHGAGTLSGKIVVTV